MDQIRIAADSSCDLLTMDGVDFVSVPLTVRTAVEEFRDDAALDVDAMVTTLRGTKGRTFSACPNIADWESAFGESGDVLAFTITSSLSGRLQRGTCRKETLRGAESLSPHFCGGHAVRRSGDRPAHRKVSRRTALRQELRGGLHSRTAVSAPYPSALCAGIHAQSRPERTNQQAGGNDGRCSRHPAPLGRPARRARLRCSANVGALEKRRSSC